MDSRWLKGIPSDERAARQKTIKECAYAFELLKEVLEKEFETPDPDYDDASWSHKQADINGANRKLRSVINLITLNKR